MEQYIDKAVAVAEIEKRITNIKEYCVREGHDRRFDVVPEQLSHILSFIDTLEVKEVYECNDVNLNPLFEEMGVEPDSRIALMFKNAFYKSVDNYLDKKEDKL